jgi:hypothetical protein
MSNQPAVSTDHTHNGTQQLEEDGDQSDQSTVHSIIIGGSNCCRLPDIDDPGVRLYATSGARAHQIEDIVETIKCDDTVVSDQVQHIITHLGTNDVTHNKDDQDQVVINIAKAFEVIHTEFPSAIISYSSILPRRGKSHQTERKNDTAKRVNAFVKKLCSRTDYLQYIDNDEQFAPSGTPVKALYDTSESSGLHVSHLGAKSLKDSFDKAILVTYHDQKNSKKRSRSKISATPPSVGRTDKHSKTGSFVE